MTNPDEHPPKQAASTSARSGIPRSQDQAMVMTQMLMRWKPRLGALRRRRRHKTDVNANPAAPQDPSSSYDGTQV